MEFHISRALRDRLAVADLLFSYNGNVVFANVAASRRLADRMNEARVAGADPGHVVNGGALFALGLIDELNHALIERYRTEIDPAILTDAMAWLTAQAGPDEVERLLLQFTQDFPNVAVYRGETTAQEWLAGTTEEVPHREAALEELLLLWLSNRNPACKPFRDLFEDAGLRDETVYGAVTETLAEYFGTRPELSAEVGSLLDALTAPMLASPDSLSGQLDFIRELLLPHLGADVRRVLLAMDVLREEDVAVWMRFHPPAAGEHGHGAPTWGSQGFEGDEFIGFEQEFSGEYVVGADGRKHRRYAADYQAPLNEYEAFSADQAWMPNVVLMAKSTYVWLEQLSKKYGRHIHRLDQIPDEELELLARHGMTGLWLIGLWERSSASQTIKRLRGHADAVASAYSLKAYDIAEDLGGAAGYEHLKRRAAAAGLRLASDMVPNHMGIDSDWVIEHPDWFLSREESPFPSYRFEGPNLSSDSRVEIKIEDHYYQQTDAAVVFRVRHHRDGRTRFMYHGNDGTTFAWNDTAQLDYSKANVREHVIQVILHVARMFPIIRFDAAMVLAKRHVQRLWFPLPGAGGSIPSRSEDAMSQEEFEALMPHEFWREVVDRVAVEVPGTLLLAEAFWLLESYFVRTLGMHRVYNSAFMNMLRDEENAKYRSYLKKTIEFDPDIMKRYVNFMSNPDERTAVDQFGDGDKYFGVSTLLATLPGLPMFGHGQIEGFTERYGMEYKQAKTVEWPREELVARHQHEIAPLLKNRRIFAESENFILYDFWTGSGTVDENVFAYSNRLGDERSIVLYNNGYEATEGTIRISAASMDKTSGTLQQRSLAEGLGLVGDDGVVVAYRDHSRGLEHLRRVSELRSTGLRMELRGYQCAVLLHWRELRSSAEHPWDRLCDELRGEGVRNLDEALWRMKLRPLHHALRLAVGWESCAAIADLGAATETTAETAAKVAADAEKLPTVKMVDDAVAKDDALPAEVVDAVQGRDEQTSHAELQPVLDRAEWFFDRLRDQGVEFGVGTRELLETKLSAALRLPALSSGLPECVARVLPVGSAGYPERWAPPQRWAPVLAWLILECWPAGAERMQRFGSLHLQAALGEAFRAPDVQGDAMWRAASRVKALLAGSTPDNEYFWSDPEVRWLAGVHESGGETYCSKEKLEDLLTWMALPRMMAGEDVGAELEAAFIAAKRAGYNLTKYLAEAEVQKTEDLAGSLQNAKV